MRKRHASTTGQPWPTIGQPLANHWPTMGHPLAIHEPAIRQPLSDHALANHWPTIGKPVQACVLALPVPLFHLLLGHSCECPTPPIPTKTTQQHPPQVASVQHHDLAKAPQRRSTKICHRPSIGHSLALECHPQRSTSNKLHPMRSTKKKLGPR